MYEVFINNNSLIFTDKKQNQFSTSTFFLQDICWNDVFSELNSGERKQKVIFCGDLNKSFQLFKQAVCLIRAGGGLVTKDNKILFIYRNKKWDLPKGKIEKNEAIEKCAVREVQEECGISKLKLDSMLLQTYHMYLQNNKWILKETTWFTMQCLSNDILVGQESEGIELVQWVEKSDVNKYVENTFPNIKKVIIAFLETKF